MKNSSDKSIELILFSVIDRVFAIDQEVIVEVLESTSASPLPFVPDYVDGLINVGGNIIPQVDLSGLLYGMESSTPLDNQFQTVLVVSIDDVPMALRVGQVQESLSIVETDIVKNKTSKKDVSHFEEIPNPGEIFIVSMVTNPGVGNQVREFLQKRNYAEGEDFILMG